MVNVLISVSYAAESGTLSSHAGRPDSSVSDCPPTFSRTTSPSTLPDIRLSMLLEDPQIDPGVTPGRSKTSLYSRTVVPRCSMPAAQVLFGWPRGVSSNSLLPISVLALRRGMEPGVVEDLVHVNVPDAGDDLLVQQQRLYLGFPGADSFHAGILPG